MIKVEENAIVEVVWDVLPIDYSREQSQNIKHKLANKLGISPRSVKVVPNFIMLNKKGEKVALTNDTIVNIQDPQFQVKLFKEYLELNKKTGYNWDILTAIDSEINSYIDYDVYDKYKKYSIKWIKWNNFLSYGKDNYFDFTKLNGLVLVNGKPANQSGKTTFAIELLRFLLFGKTSKFKTLDANFNLNLPEETELMVEGEIEIEGVDYIIKRTVTRPSLKKRSEKSKVQQKVEYYRINPDGNHELLEDKENCEEETGTQTNKAIKEAIGNEQDFDLIICATNDNLRDLVSFKETDRGRLLSRWIGLLPLEEKDKIARDKFNKEVSPKFLSNHYNREVLSSEIEDFNIAISSDEALLKNKNVMLENIEQKIVEYKSQLNILLESKRAVDDELVTLDITTHKNNIENIKREGIKHKNKKQQNVLLLEEIPEVDYNQDEYISLIERRSDLKHQMVTVKDKITLLGSEIENLKKGEFCPVCKRKYEDVDNSGLIKEKELKIEELTTQGVNMRQEYDKVNNDISTMEINKKNYEYRSKLTIENQSLDLLMDNLRSKLINANSILKNYETNKESIDFNSKVSIEINNSKARIETEEKSRDSFYREIQMIESNIKNNKQSIVKREDFIKKIAEEEELKKNWMLYLELIGKNGISKMVLRQTLPIINAELKRLLTDVCDFDVEISVNEKNDVMFTYCKEGSVPTNISGTSGLEKTIASLALRAVLANISTMPKLNFIVLDEILVSIANENYEKMKKFYDRILKDYDFILHVTFIEEINDWHSSIVTVSQDTNKCSKILHY